MGKNARKTMTNVEIEKYFEFCQKKLVMIKCRKPLYYNSKLCSNLSKPGGGPLTPMAEKKTKFFKHNREIAGK